MNRILKRIFWIGLAGLVGVIVLFYAEEDWRGHHAWRQFQREWGAKGEHFDWAGVVPPPVPDDQNFALTPVVASSYGQILDRTGHKLQTRNEELVNRLAMHYWVDGGGDSPARISEWARGIRTDLPAFQRYYRTVAAKTNQFPIPSQPQSPAADVLLALSRFDGTIEELREASRLPASRFPLEYDAKNPATILLPHLAALKSCAQVLCLRATAELQAGRSDQALADVKLQLRLVDSIRTEPVLISHLVRLAMVQLLVQPVWEGLADHRWTDAQLAELNAELAKPDFLADYKLAMHGELGFQTAFIQLLRKHPGQYAQFFDNGNNQDPSRSAEQFLAAIVLHLAPGGWFDQNELGCARIMERFYLPLAEVETRTFKPALARKGDSFLQNQLRHPSPFNLISRLLLPALGNSARKFAYGQSSLDLARVALALERYRLTTGRYPSSLEVLEPHYLEAVPHDVIGGQPLQYQATTDGRFSLYSVGWNESDDGGRVGLTQGKNPTLDLNLGDWVWRYPPTQ